LNDMEQFNQRASFECTYRMEPRENERFYPSRVQKIIEEVVELNLKDKEYVPELAQKQAEDIVNQIRTAVRGLNVPCYKIIVQSVIGQVEGQGVRLASKCLWDELNDNYASFTYKNAHLFCTGIVFGIYYE